jgi:hypothetical protein
LIEALVVGLDLLVEGAFSGNLCVSEAGAHALAGLVEGSPLSLTEGLECLLLCSEGVGESLSGLSESLSDGGGLGFEGLDQVELVVRVVDELDLLEFPGLGGIESSLLLGEGVFESGSLGIHRLNEGVVVVVEGIAEGSGVAGETVVEGSSLAVEGGGEGLSCVLEGGVLGNLHVTDEDFQAGEGGVNASLESGLLDGDQLGDLVLRVVVSTVKLVFKLMEGVDNLLTEVADVGEELGDSLGNGVKGSEVSVGKRFLERYDEAFEGRPGFSELLLKSVGEASSDVGNKLCQF